MGDNHLKEKKLAFAAGGVAIITLILVVSSIFTMSAKAKEVSSGYKYYTSIAVEKGDTLWGIASHYITPGYSDISEYISEVKSLNHLTGDEIYAGEYLTIPYYSDNILQ
ncbi:MAG: LysM peptidoglycan-binding domain-containing protein [Lachnospiraceae bacterium]|nr:LysM peptidoglycan-binding domain-containing protein [Lachnospiraceae bacterium]MDE6980480.1 LysM peptidoglycan-binding domain-containing protein [Lachnospiraceae bacterium]